ncbi:transglutaminase-like domain-containing protein, partial [Streptomyces sp. 2MCAF27]
LRPARTPAAALDVPGATPASLRALAARAHASARTPYGRARALATELEDGYVRAAGSPVSQSIGSLSRFMSSRKGSAVDFAAAFTLAAQLNGLPSRIVVGFRVPEGEGSRTVTGGDARVWSEVAFDGAGWVAFDPVPAARPVPETGVRPPSPAVSSSPSRQPPSAGSSARPAPAAPAGTPSIKA